jgi:hypothetical protein
MTARIAARNRNCINMKVGQFFMSPPGQIRMSLDTSLLWCQLGLLVAVRCAVHEGMVRAVRVERPKRLDFNSFRNCQRIFKFNTQVSDRAVNLRMPQQKLNGAQVARLLINLGDLRASH